ncbi:MAG TPA: hypothetical protein VGD08_16135 [Stellaceae bacterium]|jgi:hypothetical protein
MSASQPARRGTILSLKNETVARRLGWTPESCITWREFLEQYPYQAAEIAEIGRRNFGTAA